MGKYLMAKADVSAKTVLREGQYDSIDDQIIIDTPGKIWSLIHPDAKLNLICLSLPAAEEICGGSNHSRSGLSVFGCFLLSGAAEVVSRRGTEGRFAMRTDLVPRS